MSEMENLCPQCRRPLDLTSVGDFDTWKCSTGHGVGVVLTEAWGHLQDDELHAIWSAAKLGTPSTLLSPALGQPMVDVTVLADPDEVEANEGEGGSSISLSVDTNEQFLWFGGDSLSKMSPDLANPKPSEADVAKEQQIIQTFGENEYQAMRARQRINPIKRSANDFADRAVAHETVRSILSKISRKSGD